MFALGNSKLKTWDNRHWSFIRRRGSKCYLHLQNLKGSHDKIKRKQLVWWGRKLQQVNTIQCLKRSFWKCASVAFLSVIWKVKLQCNITTQKLQRPLFETIKTRKSRAILGKGIIICQWWVVNLWSCVGMTQRASESQIETDDVTWWFLS